MQVHLQDVPGLIVYENLSETDLIIFGKDPRTNTIVFLQTPPAWMLPADTERKEPLKQGDPVSAAGAPLGQEWFTDVCQQTLEGAKQMAPSVLMTQQSSWMVIRSVTVRDPQRSSKGNPQVAIGILIVCPHHERFNSRFSQFLETAETLPPPIQRMRSNTKNNTI